MKRKATAQWQGDLKTGTGSISAGSGVLSEVPYSFGRRFENDPGTNPEELIAAAHAACFTMALSGELGKANMKAERLRTTGTVTLEKVEAGWTVTESHLDVTGKISAGSAESFQKAAEAAKAGCPISRLLNAKITMEAKLEG